MKKQKKLLALFSALLMLALSCLPAMAKEASKINYLILGDSIGYGAGVLNSNEACFGKIVANSTGFSYKNDAVNGYRTSDLLKYLDRSNIIADVEEADIISLSICGNDFLRSNMNTLIEQAQNGDYSAFDEIAAQSIENFGMIIEKIKTINPDVLILAQTIYNPGEGVLRDVYSIATERLNAGYRTYLSENPDAYTLLEVADAFDGHDDFIATDRIHPSAAGNIAIAGEVLKALNEKGITDVTELVINNEGINQSEFFSIKYIKYIFRNFFNRVASFFKNLFS